MTVGADSAETGVAASEVTELVLGSTAAGSESADGTRVSAPRLQAARLRVSRIPTAAVRTMATLFIGGMDGHLPFSSNRNLPPLLRTDAVPDEQELLSCVCSQERTRQSVLDESMALQP